MWGRRRRRGTGTISKRHYMPSGVAFALCKKEYDESTRTTENIYNVTCKTCIKKMVKAGIATLDMFPEYPHPATTTKTKDESGEVDINDFKNAYLTRLGVF